MRLLFLLFFGLGALPAQAELPPPWQHPNRVVALQAVILCEAKEVGSQVSPDTITGSTSLIETPERYVRAQRVPAFDGVHFGITMLIRDASDADATVTVDHPPLGRQATSTESWASTLGTDEVTWNGYEVFLADGDPTGIWTFSVASRQAVIARVQFELFEPQPDTLHPCKEFPSS